MKHRAIIAKCKTEGCKAPEQVLEEQPIGRLRVNFTPEGYARTAQCAYCGQVHTYYKTDVTIKDFEEILGSPHEGA